MSDNWYKNNPTDVIWWKDTPDGVGEWLQFRQKDCVQYVRRLPQSPNPGTETDF